MRVESLGCDAFVFEEIKGNKVHQLISEIWKSLIPRGFVAAFQERTREFEEGEGL